ncbi:MAG: hypothetical protein C0605_02740 [Hyphomicrobiales bacterium]|nr:MAG: hypothetical protein C0605_02740 [Hyphomicrobiales bacterium]
MPKYPPPRPLLSRLMLCLALCIIAPAPALAGSPLPDAAMMARLTRGQMAKFRPAALPLNIPRAEFGAPDGKPRSLADWRGRMVLVNLWATWCAPCRREMRSLDNLQARLGGDGFEVIALNTDVDDATKIKAFYQRFGVRHLAAYLDSGKGAYHSLGAVGTPTNILIDCKGRELGRLSGAARWDSDEAVLLIRALMRQSGCRN